MTKQRPMYMRRILTCKPRVCRTPSGYWLAERKEVDELGYARHRSLLCVSFDQAIQYADEWVKESA